MTLPSEPSLHIKSEVFENLSLHLDDVEFLQNAFLVQAVLGPLVRFSNRGRYEPYVAKSWSQNGNSWTFHLNEGLSCEDGQTINAESFRKSLITSLKRFSAEDIQQTPFVNLVGIKTLIEKNDSSRLGISISGNSLNLEFTQPSGKALLEYLAMSPFAFLCDSNFSGHEWKSREKIISSGPYKVISFDPASNLCKLELRKDWPLNSDKSFKTIYLSKNSIPGVATTAQLEMTYGKIKSTGSREGLILEVPRALLSARLGVEKDQFFSERKNRKVLQTEVNQILERVEVPFENYHRAESFFFGQMSGHEQISHKQDPVSAPIVPLKIRGLAKGVRPEVDFYQGILFSALDKLSWKYEIMTKPIDSTKDFFNLSYDIAFDRSHVDATLDPDFVRLLFMSKLGPRYQDPGKRIAKLVEQFEKESLPYRDFLISFNTIIFEEAAILPLYHRGFSWQFSPNVDVQSISPLMSILRYEELALKPDGKN